MHAHLSPLHCHYKGMARSDQINSYPGGGTQNFNFDIEFTKILRVVIINLNLEKNGNELLGSGGGRPDGVIMRILYDD